MTAVRMSDADRAALQADIQSNNQAVSATIDGLIESLEAEVGSLMAISAAESKAVADARQMLSNLKHGWSVAKPGFTAS